MSKSMWIAAGLVSCALVDLMATGAMMLNYVQWDVREAAVRHAPGLHIICEATIHEAGYARILLGALGLLAVWIPFRRRELWAWLALAALFGGYLLPAFLLPTGFPGWAVIAQALKHPLPLGFGVSAGPEQVFVWYFLSPLLMLAGLLVSLSNFLPSKRPRARGTPSLSG